MTILLTLFRQFWPYIAAFMMGASMAGGASWKVQGLRITAAQQEFADYKQQQTRLIQEAKDAADKQRDAAGEDFARKIKVLADDIEVGDVYRRCLAVGKCDGGVRNVSASAGIRLPSAGSVDATCPGAVPAAGEVAAPVINDCAVTVLELNSLQADIENQPGYRN